MLDTGPMTWLIGVQNGGKSTEEENAGDLQKMFRVGSLRPHEPICPELDHGDRSTRSTTTYLPWLSANPARRDTGFLVDLRMELFDVDLVLQGDPGLDAVELERHLAVNFRGVGREW